MASKNHIWGTLAVAAGLLVFDQVTKIGYDGVMHGSTAGSSADTPQSTAQVILGCVLIVICLLILTGPWWAYGLLLGGSVSSMIDRLIYGAIRNPVGFGPLWWNWADLFGFIGLTVCVGYTIVSTYRSSKKRKEVNSDRSD